MPDLFYIPTDPPTTPFAVGDTVEVLDRDGTAMSRSTVVRINARTVKTSCNRTWTKNGEWYGDGRPYPFPSIRKAPMPHSRDGEWGPPNKDGSMPMD